MYKRQVQAPSYLLNLKMQAGPSLNASLDWTLFMVTSTIILAAGSMFILWLGERITDKGIGNGISFIDVYKRQPNDHAIYLDVKQFMANQRQGTHKSKERSEISGSTRKIGRQKGGGGARRGDMNSPVLVGGARVFGPKPRDYFFKLNKKVKTLARKSALSYNCLLYTSLLVAGGEEITEEIAKKIQDSPIESVEIRSVLTTNCPLPSGSCLSRYCRSV